MRGAEAVAAVADLSFEVAQGEFLTLLGPSGCGKSTTLRCIAGLETIDAGMIYLGEELASGGKVHAAPAARRVGFVFQSYAVWPHMTVAQNVGFGVRNVAESERRERVDNALTMVGLRHVAGRSPTTLSGGQQQRVSIARALAMNPRVLLLDEPFSNLDARLRKSLSIELRGIQRSLGLPTVYVTHDQEEAFAMSDQIIVMSDGRARQTGTPEGLVSRPADRFVAEFVGETTTLVGRVVARSGANATLEVMGSSIECVNALPQDIRVGDRADVVLRPWQFILASRGHGRWEGRVAGRLYRGSHWTYLIESDGASFDVDALGMEDTREVGEVVGVSVSPRATPIAFAHAVGAAG